MVQSHLSKSLYCYCLLAETKSSEMVTQSNSLGKRRQHAEDVIVSCKHSAQHNIHPPVTAVASSLYEPTGLEAPSFDDTPYNDSSLPLHVASQSPLQSPWPELSELPVSDHGSDVSASLQLFPAIMASLPSQVLQLIHSQTGPTATAGFPSQHAVEASVHPLLSMVQQVIPPLQDYSPPLPSSHIMYPSPASLPTTHHAAQSSPYAEAHNAAASMYQLSVPPLMMRTTLSTMRGSSTYAKSLPLTPKVIIVSGTGVSTATTIAGPPLTVVTTSVVTKPPPPPPPAGYFQFLLNYSDYH